MASAIWALAWPLIAAVAGFLLPFRFLAWPLAASIAGYLLQVFILYSVAPGHNVDDPNADHEELEKHKARRQYWEVVASSTCAALAIIILLAREWKQALSQKVSQKPNQKLDKKADQNDIEDVVDNMASKGEDADADENTDLQDDGSYDTDNAIVEYLKLTSRKVRQGTASQHNDLSLESLSSSTPISSRRAHPGGQNGNPARFERQDLRGSEVADLYMKLARW